MWTKGARAVRHSPLAVDHRAPHPPLAAITAARRDEKVKGTSGAAGLRNVRAFRWSAALIAGGASASLAWRPGSRSASGQSPFDHLLSLPSPAESRKRHEVSESSESGVNPARHGGGWAGDAFTSSAHPLGITKLGRSSTFGLAPPHCCNGFGSRGDRGFLRYRRLCSRSQLVAEVARHYAASTLR